ncbi:hypothetical protein [Nocardia abscessus]|uniref:hypothetical protein n=1 Tax=Nocardia abscessus TaxID=120957 RepID=UPI0024554EAB|nr:hypothetical protein [Nocardia abscessus]
MHVSALRRVLAAPMVVAVLTAGAFSAAGCSGSGGDNPAYGDATASTSSRSSSSPSTDDGDEQVTLVKIAAADLGKVNPSLPHWGGPTGINTTGAAEGGRVYSYGNSSLRGGISGLSPQVGESENDDPAVGGWTHTLTAPTPGIPGDSGSAFLDRDGRALGTLSTLGIALPIVNHVGDIHQELDYARTHSGISGLRLVLGTEPFDPNR